ncbi:hypothetical protein [Halococcus agarilyticus]|uniref:hypothetical protein n=1 Tax=Halococcus agarilyticus TaxID=1232219 RepID=UPI0012ABECAF|nr:hypothetical protein [Halococcus agarilyticus]
MNWCTTPLSIRVVMSAATFAGSGVELSVADGSRTGDTVVEEASFRRGTTTAERFVLPRSHFVLGF